MADYRDMTNDALQALARGGDSLAASELQSRGVPVASGGEKDYSGCSQAAIGIVLAWPLYALAPASVRPFVVVAVILALAGWFLKNWSCVGCVGLFLAGAFFLQFLMNHGYVNNVVYDKYGHATIIPLQSAPTTHGAAHSSSHSPAHHTTITPGH